MSGRDTAKVPKIFLSFASEDGYWVKWFTHRDWFGLPLGNVIVENYLVNERLDFGPLRIWLEQQIDDATVVIAFVSEYYRQKQWTSVEWNKALTESHRRRLIFVPVMLDADAKAWWDDLLQKGGLSGLSPDYMYSDFTDGYGERVTIGDNDAVQKKIQKLAIRIKGFLSTPSGRGVIADPHAPNGRDSAQSTHAQDPTAQSTGPEVVVLGHPTSRFAEDVAAQASALAKTAEGEAVRVQKWDDGWQSNSAARAQTAVDPGTPAVFVQPLAPVEASDQLIDVTKTGKRLGRAGVPDAAVVLWLPNAESDPDFKAAAAAPTQALPDVSALRVKPALRIDAPHELSRQLRAILRSTPVLNGPVLQIETVGSTTGKPNVEAIRLSRKLSQMFGDIVNGVIVTEAPAWEFWAEQFKLQIAQISGSRAIVAVHDLDVTPSANPVATRQSIEKKFQQMQEYVSQTECASKLKFFWAALLYNNRDALPFARYPSGRFNEWRLLSFEPNDDPAGPPVPDPASLGVFRAELCEWAAA
jgi:hypothetical protein